MNIHGAKAAVRKNNINMISAESGAPLGISISKRAPEAREAIDTGAGGKAKIIGCDGCGGWAQGQIRRTINESDGEGIPASIREKSPNTEAELMKN